MCANSEGSGETACMRWLARAFAGRQCDKYHNLMSWLKSSDRLFMFLFNIRFYMSFLFNIRFNMSF